MEENRHECKCLEIGEVNIKLAKENKLLRENVKLLTDTLETVEKRILQDEGYIKLLKKERNHYKKMMNTFRGE